MDYVIAITHQQSGPDFGVEEVAYGLTEPG
jgi:hypothetical protein